jgi:hypothetical protein
MARHRDGILASLVMAPWWVSVLVSIGAYAFVAFAAPALVGRQHRLLGPLAQELPSLAPIVALVFLIPAPLSAFRQWRAHRLLASQTGLDSIRAMPWQRFEALVAEAYRREGYRVEETGGGGPDGGIDLVVRKGSTFLVQCKHWKAYPVGVKETRELLGLVTAERAAGGVLITSGSFTSDAKDFARGKPAPARGRPSLSAPRTARPGGPIRGSDYRASDGESYRPRGLSGLPCLRPPDGPEDFEARRHGWQPVLGMPSVPPLPRHGGSLTRSTSHRADPHPKLEPSPRTPWRAPVGARRPAGLANIVVAGEGAQPAAMLKNHQVDALSQFDTQYALIESAGVKMRYLDRTAIARFPGNGFLALEETIKSRPKELIGLGRAYAKGTIFTLNNPEAAVRIVYEIFPQTKPTGKDEATAVREDTMVLEARMPHWKLEPAGVTRWGESSEVNYRDYAEFLLKWGVIKQKVDAADLITNELIGPINQLDAAKVAAEAKAYRYAR